MQLAVVDPPAEPLSGIWQQDGHGRSLAVLQGHSDGVASEFGHAGIGYDGNGSELFPAGSQGFDERRDHIGGGGSVGVEVGCDHLVLACSVHRQGVWVELAPLSKLLLGEAKSGAEEPIQVVLGLR